MHFQLCRKRGTFGVHGGRRDLTPVVLGPQSIECAPADPSAIVYVYEKGHERVVALSLHRNATGRRLYERRPAAGEISNYHMAPYPLRRALSDRIPPCPPHRRWFQVSLAEWLILTTLLGVTWWFCTQLPVAETEFRQAQVGSNGPARLREVNGVMVPTSSKQYFEFKQFAIERMPTRSEAAIRGAISSAAIISVWLAGSVAVRGIVRHRRTRTPI